MKPKLVEITEEQTMLGKVVNSFQSTLKRMSGALGYGISPDGKRNYNQIYGYGETLTYTDFYGMYRRNAIGSAVVNKVANACWNEIPTIKSGETEILVDELDELNKMGFFKALERADRLNRIGNFSVLLIGMPDGMDLDQPIGSANDLQGLYFNPYNYEGITITNWDNDPASKRFGLPVLYQLQITNLGDKSKDINAGSTVVHYSRIVHMAEGSLDSSVEGASALEPVWNDLINVLKVTGGSAEAYFRNARQQRALKADKDARLEKGSEALSNLTENLEAFTNGWEDTLRLQNMDVTNLPITMISPRDSYDVSVESISGQTGIPVRILTGKGGGQTTGTEDRASFNAMIVDRRSSECDDYLMQGLAIMSEAGMIDLPDDSVVEWPPQAAMTETEQSEVNKNKAETFNKVIDAASKIGGDEVKIKTVLDAVGLEDVEIDELDIPPIPEPVDPLPDNIGTE